MEAHLAAQGLVLAYVKGLETDGNEMLRLLCNIAKSFLSLATKSGMESNFSG